MANRWEPFSALDGRMQTFLSNGSNDFAAGDLVYLSAGYLIVCGADPSAILGIAQKAAGSVSGVEIPVVVIRPGDWFVQKFSTTTALAYVGENYGVVTTTTLNTVDLSDTSAIRVAVVGLDKRDALGTDGGRVIVSFMPYYLQTADYQHA